MHLYHLLRRELRLSNRFIVAVAILAGLTNALILYLVNSTAHAPEDASKISYLWWIVITIATFVVSQRYLLITMASDVEQTLHRIRLRLMQKIQNAELLPFEAVGRAQIYSGLSTDLITISAVSLVLTLTFQSLLLIFFGLIYVAIQSLMALVIYLVFMAIGTRIFIRRYSNLAATRHAAMRHENEMMDAVSHLLDGFREVKMDEMRRSDLHAHLEEASDIVVSLNRRTDVLTSNLNVFFSASLYTLLTVVVLALPALDAVDAEVMMSLTSAMIFLIAPLIVLVNAIPMFNNANVAADRLSQLEVAIDQHLRPMSKRQGEPLVVYEAPFRDIVFDHVEFDYVSASQGNGFHLGPLDLSISPGETIFISGGNGSGKSTFAHLLIGLYFPTRGEVRLDGQRLSESNAAMYRELFSVIFYDFHLFDRLYGLRDIDPMRVEQLLERLQLTGKTELIGDRFSTLNLSTGQKRRLSLLMSELEDKPIYVFDEWAAEQDPEFRRYFYTSILPEFKSRGKTVIAVTHDDRYYDSDYIDRILHFEEGRLR
uniref:Transporter n=1 Tax=uncultured Candidatus Entotheonella sp. TaxID=312019 RepID=A0A1L7NR28_9BACT|nr:transporter [uncultured Candidatus Entotheonella sp.]